MYPQWLSCSINNNEHFNDIIENEEAIERVIFNNKNFSEITSSSPDITTIKYSNQRAFIQFSAIVYSLVINELSQSTLSLIRSGNCELDVSIM